MGKEKQGRIDYLDTAKGIGIIMVCIGHACTNQGSVGDCKYADIIRFVTLFHMALFFFINGMLYHPKYSEQPVKGMLKKFRAYYVPFVTYNILFWVLHNLFAKLHLISGELDPKDYAYHGARQYITSLVKSIVGFRQRFAGAMWFLEALIVISLTFILIDYVAGRLFPSKRIIAVTVMVATVVLVNRLFNLSDIPRIPGSLTQMVYWGFNGLLFFYLGYLYQSFQWNTKLLRYRYPIAVCCGAGLIIAVILMRPRVVSVITNVSIPIYKSLSGTFVGGEGKVGLPLIPYTIYSFICLAGIIMIVLISQFRTMAGSEILKTMGRYSLHIMCLQFLAFKSISLLIVSVYHLPVERLAEYPVIRDIDGLWWLVYTVSGCVLPVLAVKLYETAKGKVFVIRKRRNES